MDILPPPPPTTATTNVGGSEVKPPIGVYQPSPLMGFAYGKCNKNYAASNGKHVLDGCGEFMPSFTSASRYIYCNACGCHRSFHHQTKYHYPPYNYVIQYPFPPLHLHRPQTSDMPRSNNTPSSPPLSPSPISSYYPPTSLHPQPIVNNRRTKRVRSKFSNNQKKEMLSFAEKIGWKLLKKDEEMVLEFCMAIGVTKQVFRVWMNNHRNLRHVN
ncbi:putative transcription factor ZF-HD family [Helianthus annuus]|nr:putative transcription factor ZF-HD family [Helianthus annuus]